MRCPLRPLSVPCIRSNCDRRHYTHKLFRVMRLLLLRRFFDLKAQRIVAVHEGMRSLLEKGGVGPSSIAVLRNPVVPWRADRVPAERNRTFLFVGQLDEDKGPDIAAHAASLGAVPLRVIGDGPLANRLVSEFPDVEFVGWKSREEIANLCLDARAVIVPTRSRETFGLAALEALTSGLPLVISQNALLAQEITDGSFGLKFEPRDVGALALLLKRVSEDDVLVATMSRNGYAKAQGLAPTPTKWTNQVIAMYQAILEPRSKDDLH